MNDPDRVVVRYGLITCLPDYKPFRELSNADNMEDLTSFNRCIELDPGTRKLILDMIGSMKSLIPDDPAMASSSGYSNSPFTGEFIREVLKVAANHEGLLSGIVEPGSIEKLLQHANNLREIGDQIEKLLHAVRNYQEMASFLSYKQAGLVKEHLELIVPGSCRKAEEVDQKMKQKNFNHQPVSNKNIKLKII
jgi:hypothetical protein